MDSSNIRECIDSLIAALRKEHARMLRDSSYVDTEYERDALVRDVVRRILRSMRVDGAHGCPLCMG